MKRYMIVLVYLGSQCTKFHADGWACSFFKVGIVRSRTKGHGVCVCVCIWSSVWCHFAMDASASVHKILCKSRKKYDGDLGIHWISLRGRRHELCTTVWTEQSKTAETEKMARQVKSEVKGMLSLSLASRGLFTKNSSWHAKQTISHINVMF
jgi:hypothetical protein